jgi:hypothetical protein
MPSKSKSPFKPQLSPGQRCTIYWFAKNHGLPTTFNYLAALGQAVNKRAGWIGLLPGKVQEGPYVVNSWPETVIARIARLVPPE